MGCLKLTHNQQPELRVVHGKKAVTSNDWVKRVRSSYLFGMLMPGRHDEINGRTYAYGFQGQERDDEVKGAGNAINYKFRMHDPRLGRFFAVDPLAADFPWNSTYAFSENRVIDRVELEGAESSAEWRWSFLNPRPALRIRNNAAIAVSHSENRKLPGMRDGQQDAFRHSFWNVLNTIDVGQSTAKEYADLHESSNKPNSDPVAVEMDLYNNMIGRKIASEYLESIGGKENLPKDDAWESDVGELVQKALDEGRMKVISMDSKNNYLDADGYRINTSVEGWEKQKHLVQSNVERPDASTTTNRPGEAGAAPDNSKKQKEY